VSVSTQRRPKRTSRIQGIEVNVPLYRNWIAVLFALPATAGAQTFTVTRDEAAYHPNNILHPATLLSSNSFRSTESGKYVIIEGYVDYHATAWPEKDGDYHFEMQSTKKKHTRNPVDGLVCEIDPVLQLKGSEALKKINKDDQRTYGKVRVYGWLRFGTEQSHAGVQRYEVAPGKTVQGHWEIHPVGKVETIDNRVPFKIGQEAKYVKPPTHGNGSLEERYKINDEHFP
jgi:hypothetical protein